VLGEPSSTRIIDTKSQIKKGKKRASRYAPPKVYCYRERRDAPAKSLTLAGFSLAALSVRLGGTLMGFRGVAMSLFRMLVTAVMIAFFVVISRCPV